MTPFLNGPQAYTREERSDRTAAITDRLHAQYGPSLLALGLYGSHGRGTDGPYSDIEIHCVIAGSEIDTSYEWSEGPWKAEVDVYSPEVFLAQAAELDEFWPITHGAYAGVVSLFDSVGIFPRAAQAVFAHSTDEFDTLIREVLIGDLYEVVGKARNALALNRPFSLAGEAVDAARYAACLMGLAHRVLFTTGPAALPEALQLPDRPDHFDAFLNRVLRGDLQDNPAVAAGLDALWDGMEAWALRRGLNLHRRFADLLSER